MDMHSDLVEPCTPGLTYHNLWRAEDSGYHTFTPSSIDCSSISNENVDSADIERRIRITRKILPIQYDNSTPDVNFQYSFTRRLTSTHIDSPDRRRGLKRPYQDDFDTTDTSYVSISTPTSVIAGGIRKLRVNDGSHFNRSYSVSLNSENTDPNNVFQLDAQALSFPSTPIKKQCKSSCKLNKERSNLKKCPLRALNGTNCPPRNFNRQLDFEIHSLTCEPQSLLVIKHKPQCTSEATFKIKPNQKIDMIKMLYQVVCCTPAIKKIFSYMTPVDIFNISLVSPTWMKICDDLKDSRIKLSKYLELSRENQENKRICTPKVNKDITRGHLRDIHNIRKISSSTSTPNSPPVSPKSRRFIVFTKSASLDSRTQLVCVRCKQPAKVTEEESGEVWAECMRPACAYQFCRYCNCNRHPGKTCIGYDYDGASPSKRKKKSCAAGSMQSRKNLRRLLKL